MEKCHKLESYKKNRYLEINYNTLIMIRKIFILYILFEEILFWYNYTVKTGFQIKIFQLKEWNHFLCLISYLTLINLKTDKKITKNYSSIFHLLFSVQMSGTLIYWTLIHKKAILKNHTKISLFLLYSKHLTPFLFIFLDMMFNNIFLSEKSMGIILPYCLFWGVYNFVFTFFFGFKIYDFITYRDVKSYLVVVFVALLSFGCGKICLKLQRFKFVNKKN